MDKLWIAQNGTIEEFDHDLDTYQKMLTGTGQRERGGRKAAAAPAEDRKGQRQGCGGEAGGSGARCAKSVKDLDKSCID